LSVRLYWLLMVIEVVARAKPLKILALPSGIEPLSPP
jgi:hypothetical protein